MKEEWVEEKRELEVMTFHNWWFVCEPHTSKDKNFANLILMWLKSCSPWLIFLVHRNWLVGLTRYVAKFVLFAKLNWYCLLRSHWGCNQETKSKPIASEFQAIFSALTSSWSKIAIKVNHIFARQVSKIIPLIHSVTFSHSGGSSFECLQCWARRHGHRHTVPY